MCKMSINMYTICCQPMYYLQEWGDSCPHDFVGAFKLEHDMSWTPSEYIEQRSQDFALIDKVMNAQNALVDAEAPNFKGLTSQSRNNSSAKLTDVSHITGDNTSTTNT